MDQMKIYRVEQKNEEAVEVQIIRSSRRSMQVMDYAVQ